ncbi:energy transducer TonB [Algoriphagus boritolerans]
MSPQLAVVSDFPEILEVPITDKMPPIPSNLDLRNIVEVPADEVFDVVEEQPSPQGGMNGWNQYLAKNITYPAQARQLGIEGTVIVVFEIQKDGSIRNVEILRGIGGGADEEAVRVVQNAPKWQPGKQRGREVITRMRLPIRFKLASISESNLISAKSIEEPKVIPSEPLQEIAEIAY